MKILLFGSLLGPPTVSSRYHKNVDPFSYGTTENASSGSTPSKLTTSAVRGFVSPSVSI